MLARPESEADPHIVQKDFPTSSRPLLRSQKKLQGHTMIDVEDGSAQFSGIPNELVVFNPGSSSGEHLHPPPDHSAAPNHSSRVLPSVGAFTVQCAACFKWRLIPTKEKYEQIRESILQVPFVCEKAREWRPDISCDDQPDILQDGSRLWAIDKPNIAQPPPGWDRQLRIRGEGGTRFADVYYVAPTGKKLRSMVEIQRYLHEHPEYVACGVNLSQFSFQVPKPLQENYVRKKNSRPMNAGLGLPGLHVEAFPLSWAAPPIEQTAEAEEPEPASDIPSSESPPAKKRVAKEQVRRPLTKKMCASSSPNNFPLTAKFENFPQEKEGPNEL